MSIIRVKKNNNYTVMNNHHLFDKNLSMKSKGLLSMCLALRDDWKYSLEGLVSISKESKTSVKTALSELEEFHYLKIDRLQDDKGRFEYEYTFFEYPYDDYPCTENPYTDNPYTDNPCMENVPLLSTNVLSTKELNTKLSNTKELKDITNNDEKIEIGKRVIEYLDQRTGGRYKPTKSNLSHITARLDENYTEQDCMDVIDKKCVEWMGDEKMEKFLRPETLFSPTKFQNYLSQPVHQKKKEKEEMAF